MPYSKDFIPAKINPSNFADLQLALHSCNIEKAQVAGWNDHDDTFILYKNGTVVPSRKDNLPNVALFFKKCECNNFQVVCVYDPDKPNPRCILPCSYPVNVSKACFTIPETPNPCIERINRPLPCCNYDNPQPLPKPYECPPKCFNSCLSKVCEECPVFVQKIKMIDCNEDVKKVQKIKACQIYTYKTIKQDKRCETIVSVVSECSKKTKEEINLSECSKRLRPEVLNYPRKLCVIKKCIERYLKKKICLYTTRCNNLYILVDNVLWKIIKSPCKESLVLVKQTDSKAKKLC
ncbi:MAG: hypothetical protein KC414_13215, partial [Romboutsia sp.]|nr:hypothetical protein [Romboutsia sp.]